MSGRVALLVMLCGCVGVDTATRVERGPLLRTFQRPSVLEGVVTAEAAVDWPKLNLAIRASDVCREETVEEYAEEHITERSTPAAGASLATGIAAVLGSAVLFGVSYAFANTPDTRTIDAAGRYGPSTRQTLQGISLGAAIFGVPALITGIVGVLRSGVDVDAKRAEQVASQRDTPCHLRGVDGPLVVRSARGEESTPRAVVAGQVALLPADVVQGVDELRFAGKALQLTETAQHTLDAYIACAQSEGALQVRSAEGLETTVTTPEGNVVRDGQRLRACRLVRPEIQAALDVQLAAEKRLRESGDPGAFPPASQATRFEDAVAGMAPKLRFSADSADSKQLDDAQSLEGQAVFIVGVVEGVISPNIGVVQLGERRVFLFIPTNKPWGGDFGVGARIEVVAVMAGVQTVGERTLPVARAAWIRSAF